MQQRGAEGQAVAPHGLPQYRSLEGRGGMEIDEALDYVQRRKPSADPLAHQRADLQRWWRARENSA